MNQMDRVAKMLGVELFEKFELRHKARFQGINVTPAKQIRNPYYFTDEGLVNRHAVNQNALLPDLITGDYIVTPLKDIPPVEYIERFTLIADLESLSETLRESASMSDSGEDRLIVQALGVERAIERVKAAFSVTAHPLISLGELDQMRYEDNIWIEYLSGGCGRWEKFCSHSNGMLTLIGRPALEDENYGRTWHPYRIPPTERPRPVTQREWDTTDQEVK